MGQSRPRYSLSHLRIAQHCCNHPLAVIVDPTDRQLRELEDMLAKCPNCSQWTPGDGPIMAILSSGGSSDRRDDAEPLGSEFLGGLNYRKS